jgi:uncharacterized protein YfaS (alpha-2-macroglobulin family)
MPATQPIQLEWRNPNNVLVTKKVFNYSKGSIIPMHLATDTEAPTGIWSATVKVGGAAFTKLLNIETIKPNRLKITFTPDKNQLMAGSSIVDARLNTAWLIGSIAGNLRTTIEANLRSNNQPFENIKILLSIMKHPTKTFKKLYLKEVLTMPEMPIFN